METQREKMLVNEYVCEWVERERERKKERESERD